MDIFENQGEPDPNTLTPQEWLKSIDRRIARIEGIAGDIEEHLKQIIRLLEPSSKKGR